MKILTVNAHQIAWCSFLLILVGNSSAIAEDYRIHAVTPAPRSPVIVHSSDTWKRVESENFRCSCQLDQKAAQQLAEICETWRNDLRTTWISEPVRESWVPKCEVVVHPNCAQYNRAMNCTGDVSVGCTRVTLDGDRVVLRRIDLRADIGDWAQAALPHELTHVVLRERFGVRLVPRWADEGIAMLSESPEKHQERLQHLRNAIAKHSVFTMNSLIRTQCVTDPHLRDAFYGQSLALSSFLIRKSTPARFADFVYDSAEIGFDDALKKQYQLDGMAAMQREWDNWTKRPEDIRFARISIEIAPDAKSAYVDR